MPVTYDDFFTYLEEKLGKATCDHSLRYTRAFARRHGLSFDGLRDEVEQRGNLLVPRDVQKLDGQKVFIKGFMRADSIQFSHNVREFRLVRDNNQCCFGDLSNVKYFDQVLVSTVGSLSTDYSTGIYRVGGILHIHPENILRGVGYPVYTLEADHLK